MKRLIKAIRSVLWDFVKMVLTISLVILGITFIIFLLNKFPVITGCTIAFSILIIAVIFEMDDTK